MKYFQCFLEAEEEWADLALEWVEWAECQEEQDLKEVVLKDIISDFKLCFIYFFVPKIKIVK
jgi:hypothetical protein